MREDVMNRWTTILAIAVALILLIVSGLDVGATGHPEAPLAPAVEAQQAEDGHTWGEAIQIAWAVARRGWAGLPDSPHIGCSNRPPGPATCWIGLSGGGQLWIRVPGQ